MVRRFFLMITRFVVKMGQRDTAKPGFWKTAFEPVFAAVARGMTKTRKMMKRYCQPKMMLARRSI